MVSRNDLGVLFISEFWAELSAISPVYTQEEWIKRAWITDIAHAVLGMSNLWIFSIAEKWKEGFVEKDVWMIPWRVATFSCLLQGHVFSWKL